MATCTAATLALALAACLAPCYALQQLLPYGSDPDSSQISTGHEWNYLNSGLDWSGNTADGSPWVCLTGKKQSPINVVPSDASFVHPGQQAVLDGGVIQSTSIQVTNNGHTVLVTWQNPTSASNFSIVVADDASQPATSSLQLPPGASGRRVTVTPLQFHLHTHSEHTIQGKLFPLEAHIVCTIPAATWPGCGPDGCTVVIGIMFELSDDLVAENAFLKPILDEMPMREGVTTTLSAGTTLDFTALIPSNHSYVSYEGSLTTPPCTEGVLWLLMLQSQKISTSQWIQFLTATGGYNCTSSTAKRPKRLLLQQAASRPSYSCSKLHNGANARLPQLLNGRVTKLYVEGGSAAADGSSTVSGYLPTDSSKALAAGAIAGIIIGTLGGAGLTALIGYLMYKQYKKRRIKKLYYGWEDDAAVQIMERDAGQNRLIKRGDDNL
eukprot:jgi/Chrzof1/8794/Cz03g24230.t1